MYWHAHRTDSRTDPRKRAMNRTLLLLGPVLLLALPAAGCGSNKPTEEDYLAIVRKTVSFAEDDARRAAAEGAATGPLLLDVNSFRGGSLRATGTVIAPEKISRAIGREFRPTVPDSSFRCLETELGPTCWVPKQGVFVHLNLASRTPDRIIMHYTSTVTASNFIPPVLCDRAFRLEFARDGRDWVIRDTIPVKSC